MGALYPLLFYFICALGPFASLRAEAGAVVQSCCNALTVGCDVWQKERESYKQGYKNKDCSSGSASVVVSCKLYNNPTSVYL